MNKIVLTGYIASDVEVRSTQQGRSVSKFSLAVKRPRAKEDVTDFFKVVCWGNTADFVAKYFKKGSGIEVSGMLTTKSWEDSNGNKRYATEIVAEDVDFGKRSKEDTGTQSYYAPSQPQDTGYFDIPDDEDIPF